MHLSNARSPIISILDGITIFFRLVHAINVPFGTIVKLLGIFTTSRAVHSENTLVPNFFMLSGNVIVFNDVHPLKLPFEILTTLLDKVTFVNFSHPLNTFFISATSFGPSSSITVCNLTQLMNASADILVTLLDIFTLSIIVFCPYFGDSPAATSSGLRHIANAPTAISFTGLPFITGGITTSLTICSYSSFIPIMFSPDDNSPYSKYSSGDTSAPLTIADGVVIVSITVPMLDSTKLSDLFLLTSLATVI